MSVKTQSGGMFNSYKVHYSPETHKLLRVLMDEVKLTTSQRNQVKESLKKGDPLPMAVRKCNRPSFVDENLFGLKRNYFFVRRGREQIIHSGAYERERYKFLGKMVDLEKEKERLRNIMTYGKTSDECYATPSHSKTKNVKITAEDRIQELIIEIEERLEFLKEMKNIGKGKNYETLIREEIAGKLREMQKLDKTTAEKYILIADLRKK